MCEYQGSVILGGTSIRANTLLSAPIVRVDGSQASLIGTGFNAIDNVYDMVVFNGDLVAGGRENALGKILRWDGTNWWPMGASLTGGAVRALAVHDGVLYAGGDFDLSGAMPLNHIAMWSGSEWLSVGAGFNSTLLDLCSHSGQLYACGQFTFSGDSAIVLNRIAVFDGLSWSPVGTGLNDICRSLCSHSDGLYIGGQFSADAVNQLALPYIAKFDGSQLLNTGLSLDLNSVRMLSTADNGDLLISDWIALYRIGLSGAQRIPIAHVESALEENGQFFFAGSFPYSSYREVRRFGELIAGTDVGSLGINNVSVNQTPTPILFGAEPIGEPGFEAPLGSGNIVLWNSFPMITARLNGQLHGSRAAQGNQDPYPSGPIASTMDDEFGRKYHQVWEVSHGMIAAHEQHWNDVGYQVPYLFATWPAHGDTLNGEPWHLAPFNDANNNEIYEPQLGESPSIRGDAAVYAIMHSDQPPIASSLLPMPVDIHILNYAFDSPWLPELHNTIFSNIKIIERASLQWDSLRIGLSTYWYLGDMSDNFAGCDTALSTYFGYNGDAYDDLTSNGGYLDHPPAVGIVHLNHALSSFVGDIQTPNTITGWEEMVMMGRREDGSYVISPQNDTTLFETPGDPSAPMEWSEVSAGNTPSGCRSVGAVGPFTLLPGDTICLDLAFVFAQDTLGDNLTSVTLLKQRVAQVQDWYAQQDINCTGSYGVVTGLSSQQTSVDGFELFPNPTTGVLSLSRTSGKSASVQVFSTTGSLLSVSSWTAGNSSLTLDVSALPAGVYVIVLQDNASRTTKRFVKADG